MMEEIYVLRVYEKGEVKETVETHDFPTENVIADVLRKHTSGCRAEVSKGFYLLPFE